MLTCISVSGEVFGSSFVFLFSNVLNILKLQFSIMQCVKNHLLLSQTLWIACPGLILSLPLSSSPAVLSSGSWDLLLHTRLLPSGS